MFKLLKKTVFPHYETRWMETDLRFYQESVAWETKRHMESDKLKFKVVEVD